MYKKRIAMDQSNGLNDDSAVGDPLAEVADEETPTENGHSDKKSGRKKSKRKSGILKISRKKITKKTKPSESAPEPDAEGEYEVESIVGHKKEKGKTLYRVHWKGYSSKEDTWEAGPGLSCKDLLQKYKKALKKETKDVYNVSEIIDHRRMKGTIYYRVRWENYSAKDDTWQPKEMLNCNDLLKSYHDSLNESILKREEAKLEALEKAKKSNGEFEVESIVDSKTFKGKTKYLVRWKNYDQSDDTWQAEETLNCPELIRAFNKKSPAKKAKAKAKKAKKRKYDDSGTEDDDSDGSDFGSKAKKGAGGEYEVEKVLDARINRQGKWEFFVMWKGWSPDHNNWEPESNLNCPKLIDQYLGKDKVPLAVRAKLEKVTASIVTPPKAKRKPPSERKTPAIGGLRGRTKGERKVLT